MWEPQFDGVADEMDGMARRNGKGDMALGRGWMMLALRGFGGAACAGVAAKTARLRLLLDVIGRRVLIGSQAKPNADRCLNTPPQWQPALNVFYLISTQHECHSKSKSLGHFLELSHCEAPARSPPLQCLCIASAVGNMPLCRSLINTRHPLILVNLDSR